MVGKEIAPRGLAKGVSRRVSPASGRNMGHNLWAVLANASATDLSLASGGGFSGVPYLLQLGHGVVLLLLLHVRHLQYHLQLRYLGQAPDLLHLPFLHQAPDLLHLPYLHEVRDPLQLPSLRPVNGQPGQGVYLDDMAFFDSKTGTAATGRGDVVGGGTIETDPASNDICLLVYFPVRFKHLSDFAHGMFSCK